MVPSFWGFFLGPVKWEQLLIARYSFGKKQPQPGKTFESVWKFKKKKKPCQEETIWPKYCARSNITMKCDRMPCMGPMSIYKVFKISMLCCRVLHDKLKFKGSSTKMTAEFLKHLLHSSFTNMMWNWPEGVLLRQCLNLP